MMHVAGYAKPASPSRRRADAKPRRQAGREPPPTASAPSRRPLLRRSPSKPRRLIRSAPCPARRAKAKSDAARPPQSAGAQPRQDHQGFRLPLMNAPTPALVARPERLRLVGQRRQILAVMHQRLMIGMLIYGGDRRASSCCAWSISRRSATMPGARAARSTSPPSAATSSTATASRWRVTIDAWTIGLQPAQVIGDKFALAQKLAELMPEKDAATYLAHAPLEAANSITSAAAPRRGWSTRSTRSASRAWRSSREPDRLYPQTALAAHVLGYTDVDGKGSAGIERAFNDRLRDPAQRGAAARSCRSRARSSRRSSMSCSGAMTQFSAIGAAGIIMNIHTGEVLAMTSLPQLNPNAAGQWHRPRRASTAPRSASTSLARPSSRSPWRWRWTRAS